MRHLRVWFRVTRKNKVCNSIKWSKSTEEKRNKDLTLFSSCWWIWTEKSLFWSFYGLGIYRLFNVVIPDLNNFKQHYDKSNINYKIITITSTFKMLQMNFGRTLVKKYSLMSLQSGGMDWVTSLSSQTKNGKVLWKNSVSSCRARTLAPPLPERSLIRWDNFTIKLSKR